MYISDLDLIKVKLTVEGKLNQSEVIKSILQDWSVDEKQRFMAVGERYYNGQHDILNHDFRRSVVYDKVSAEDSDDGKERCRLGAPVLRPGRHSALYRCAGE